MAATSDNEWVSLDSSNIQQARYDGRLKMLTIQFHGRADDGTGEYVYLGVPRDVWNGLLAAESAGKYYHQFIKPRFKIYRGLKP